MLTKEDKGWIIESFVTRGEFRNDMHEVKEGISRVEVTVNKVLAVVEGLAGKIDVLDQENKMGSITLSRHEKHIQELATATETTLSN